MIRDYASNVKRMLEVIKTVDIPEREPDTISKPSPVKYGKVIDLYNTMQALISGGGVAPTSTSGTQGSMGMQRGGYGGGSRFGGAGNYGSATAAAMAAPGAPMADTAGAACLPMKIPSSD